MNHTSSYISRTIAEGAGKMKMRYCKRCLQPDTRPGIVFDDEQICFACRYEESKATIDWDARTAELKAFAEEAKAEAVKRGNTYDCIIGVSGGNLYVWTRYQGWDPDVNSYGTNIRKMGVDSGSYPSSKTYSMDIKLTF